MRGPSIGNIVTMCGIIFEKADGDFLLNDTEYDVTHRGPDSSSTHHDKVRGVKMQFDRLNITSPHDGHQPFVRHGVYLMCNGEIYNYQEIIDTHALKDKMQTGSDCEVLLHLYLTKGGDTFLDDVDGEFAYVIWDAARGQVLYGRDNFGIRPLYVYMNATNILLTSECIHKEQTQVKPGVQHTWEELTGVFVTRRFHQQPLLAPHLSQLGVRDAFVESVRSRISQGDQQVGFFLSGGLDSGLVLAIACRLYAHGLANTRGDEVHCFTIGANDSKDTVLAVKVVQFLREKYPLIKLKHHLVNMDPDEAFATLPDLIQAIKTYDTTTVRASMGQYLLARYISQNTDVKVVMSGEGADELLGGYLYFRHTPKKMNKVKTAEFVNKYVGSLAKPPRDGRPFKAEVMRLMEKLHMYDNLRTDRTTASFGLEVRVPFLQNKFISAVMAHPRHHVEPGTKNLMRREFDDKKEPWLPDCVLWGTKEAFSDGVGHSWLDTIRERAVHEVNRRIVFRAGVETDEQKLYIQLWHELFGGWKNPCPEGYWLPNIDWVDTKGEASARALKVYKD